MGQIYKKGRLFIDFEIEFPAKGSLTADQLALLGKALPAPKEARSYAFLCDCCAYYRSILCLYSCICVL